MKSNKSILLGVCPIGKFIFSLEDAIYQKKLILEKLDSWNINYISLEGLLPEGMVRSQEQVETVVEFFKEREVDAVFMPHCNFGTESAAGLIGKKLNVPVLLWGPRDGSPLPDGSRLRDTLCGLFATSKVLNKLKVPFSYIENCPVEAPKFEEGLKKFIRTASVVKTMRNMRIGQIGSRIDFFWSTIANENELLDKFGIQVEPIDIVDFINNVKDRAERNKKEYLQELISIKKWLVPGEKTKDEHLVRGLALRDELIGLVKDRNLDALSVQTISSVPRELGPGLGLGYCLAQDEISLAYESDLHGAISLAILKSAAKVPQPCFFPDIVSRHPDNDNAVLLWHGAAPLKLKHPDCKTVEMLPYWTIKDLPPTNLSFRLKEGNITMCRFDGENGNYVLGFGEGRAVPGPYTREFYTWMEVDNWPAWEKKLIEGPFIHHVACIYDSCSDVLEEACKFIPGLYPVKFDDKKNLQEAW